MTSWHSYPSIFNFGHKAVRDIFSKPVIVEEKVDGSQFSFGLINGELRLKSKKQEFTVDTAPTLFRLAAQTVKKLSDDLVPEYTYRGEYLSKPQHNTLAYDRVPGQHIIIFDINDAEESYLTVNEKRFEALRLGLECVPMFLAGDSVTYQDILGFLETTSVLGGQKVEGVVVKSLSLYGEDKKLLIAKHVSEAFKEIHGGEWRKNNPAKSDIIAGLIARYGGPARYAKAVQHLRDEGVLEDSPRDIGKLIPELKQDWAKECEDDVKAILWTHFRDQIERGVLAGFPTWYKSELLKQQFGEPELEEELIAA
jgi:hypothetical protein